jgi:6-phosphogluconate dehydrogenase
MTNKQPQQRYEIGMVGLGVMGRNLMLNMADHGCAVAGYDKDQTKVEALRKESAERNIRAALLEDICAAFHARRDLPNLLLAPNLSRKVMEHQECLCQVVCQAAKLGVPAPGLMVSLGYLDAYRSAWLPANLIQAQRDYFGAHTYERFDAKGTFHTEWEKK